MAKGVSIRHVHLSQQVNNQGLGYLDRSPLNVSAAACLFYFLLLCKGVAKVRIQTGVAYMTAFLTRRTKRKSIHLIIVLDAQCLLFPFFALIRFIITETRA